MYRQGGGRGGGRGGDGPEVVDFGKLAQGLKMNGRVIVAIIILVALVIWVLQGGPLYTVGPDEEGVVMTFGRYSKSTQPGLHFKLPWPIQTVMTPKVAEVKRLEFGFRSSGSGAAAQYTSFMDEAWLLDEAQMLTGDENVVDVSMAVQYQISDATDYLFNYRDPADVVSTLRGIGEAALRQAVGDRPIDDVLTTRKLEVQNEVMDTMERLAEEYRTGVRINEVQLQDVQPPRQVAQAFLDVATAREEREKIINEARAYQREKIPEAEGKAERLLQDAEGYRAARIASAEGSVARFLAIYEQYRQSPDVTKTRMYLDMMEELLPKVKITVIDEEAGVFNIRPVGQTAPVFQGGQR